MSSGLREVATTPDADQAADEPILFTAEPLRVVGRDEKLWSTHLIDKPIAEDDGLSLTQADGLNLLRVLILGSVEKPPKGSERKFLDWDNEQCLQYGGFLVKLVAPKELSVKIITNAARLGLGPGDAGLKRRFGSLREYYAQLGVSKDNPRGHFDVWGTEDFVRYVSEVAEANGGYISERILKEHYQELKKQGTPVPSLTIIKSRVGPIGALAKEIGAHTPPNHTPHYDSQLQAGILFVETEGRLPTKKDFSRDDLPSTNSAFRNFGGIKAYQKAILEARQRANLERMAA